MFLSRALTVFLVFTGMPAYAMSIKVPDIAVCFTLLEVMPPSVL